MLHNTVKTWQNSLKKASQPLYKDIEDKNSEF